MRVVDLKLKVVTEDWPSRKTFPTNIINLMKKDWLVRSKILSNNNKSSLITYKKGWKREFKRNKKTLHYIKVNWTSVTNQEHLSSTLKNKWTTWLNQGLRFLLALSIIKFKQNSKSNKYKQLLLLLLILTVVNLELWLN